MTALLANGDFPCSEKTLSLLRKADRIVCCDGAIGGLEKISLVPDVIIGDLDSFPEEKREKYAKILVREEEQETNDLCKAFRYCMAHGWTDLLILGGTGKREDHTLGNISYLADFMDSVPGIRMVTETGEFLPVSSPFSMTLPPGRKVSIFSMDPDLAVTSEGLKYPLRGLKLTRWWNATLNEVSGKNGFRLEFPGGKLILFLPDPENQGGVHA